MSTNSNKFILALSLACVVPYLQAASLPSALTADVGVAYDESSVVTTDDSTPSATSHSGAIGIEVGGAATITSFEQDASAASPTVTGTNPLAGSLTDYADGLGGILDMTGVLSDGTISEQITGIDFFMDFENLSLTDPLEITVGLDFSLFVDSASGGDNYSATELVLNHDATEIFFAKYVSDSVFGNAAGSTTTTDSFDPTGGLGGLLGEAGLFLYTFLLDAGATTTFSGFLTVEGGAYEIADSSYSSSNSFNLDVVAPVPEINAGQLGLALTLLLGLVALRRERSEVH